MLKIIDYSFFSVRLHTHYIRITLFSILYRLVIYGATKNHYSFSDFFIASARENLLFVFFLLRAVSIKIVIKTVMILKTLLTTVLRRDFKKCNVSVIGVNYYSFKSVMNEKVGR